MESFGSDFSISSFHFLKNQILVKKYQIFTLILDHKINFMRSNTTFIFAFLALWTSTSTAQDTFSIVAADSVTREVGSAGASCVDLIAFGIADASFLGDLLPDTGAINTQASYLAGNQANARKRMRAGDTPEEILTWLKANDSQAAVRQYGIVGFNKQSPSSAGFTGANCINYKAHKTGSINGIHYSIQGNILLGQMVLDSMEVRFRNSDGDLACRLMAALQGANMIGADTRCASNESSSLFAFLKVAQATDQYGSPSFSISVVTKDKDQIEPIDSLQTIFDAKNQCINTSNSDNQLKNVIKIYPNPSKDFLTIELRNAVIGTPFDVIDLLGQVVFTGKLESDRTDISIQNLPNGLYLFRTAYGQATNFIKLD